MKSSAYSILATTLLFAPASAQTDAALAPYLEVLEKQGRSPLDFVIDQLDEVDLIVFDDAWHPASEPFEFYQALVRSAEFRKRAKYVFVEALPINKQFCVNAYLNAPSEDRTLLYPAFQDDFSGTGWPFGTYFDLLSTIYEVNSNLAMEERLHVVAVNSATYWSEIHTAEDIRLFRKTLIGNDYTMYRTIAEALEDFSGTRKGIFLTNTRHAYKGIRDEGGRYFLNAGTFLHQRHPGRTTSIRFHNLALSIEGEKAEDPGRAETTAGMERYSYSWIRMQNGLWDSAFEAFGNRPIAVPLVGNVFGESPYVGNHMHKAAPGQTMADANDALIFLAPLENLHNTAMVAEIYTPEFKAELVRRYRMLYTTDQLRTKLERNEVETLEELIEIECAPASRELIPQAQSLPPKDAWKQMGP